MELDRKIKREIRRLARTSSHPLRWDRIQE